MRTSRAALALPPRTTWPCALAPAGVGTAGYSSCDGLVIDVSRLNGVRVDTSSNTAVIGAGTLLIDVYDGVGANRPLAARQLVPHRWACGTGQLGGGIGVFARRYGLTSDNLRASRSSRPMDLVRANESEHTDMLWASRGGGGGNFGVVASSRSTSTPCLRSPSSRCQYPWTVAATILEAWLRPGRHRCPMNSGRDCVLESQGT